MKLGAGGDRVDEVKGVNAYLVDREDGVMLVDTGMPGNADKILGRTIHLGDGASVEGGALSR